MTSAQLDFRDQFIQILNNWDRVRNRGFVIFVHCAIDLAPLRSCALALTKPLITVSPPATELGLETSSIRLYRLLFGMPGHF